MPAYLIGIPTSLQFDVFTTVEEQKKRIAGIANGRDRRFAQIDLETDILKLRGACSRVGHHKVNQMEISVSPGRGLAHYISAVEAIPIEKGGNPC